MDVLQQALTQAIVTNLTNLYSQTLMPSLDYTLSFHIGLMARVAARREPEGSEAEQEFLVVTNSKDGAWFFACRGQARSYELAIQGKSRIS